MTSCSRPHRPPLPNGHRQNQDADRQCVDRNQHLPRDEAASQCGWASYGFLPHSFRVTAITDLLEHNTALDDVQHLASHADPRTTRLYDRRRRKITRIIVERISINVEER